MRGGAGGDGMWACAAGKGAPQAQKCACASKQRAHLDAGQRLQHALQVVLGDGGGRGNVLVAQRLGVVEQHEHRHLQVKRGAGLAGKVRRVGGTKQDWCLINNPKPT